MKKKPKFIDVYPGAAPAGAIWATLGLDVNDGPVKCAAPALNHAARRHPQDVPIILPQLSSIIENPLYMGDDGRNPGKIELVGKVTGHPGAALVALCIEMNTGDGHYHVCSMYLISQAELDRKRHKGVLKVTKWPATP